GWMIRIYLMTTMWNYGTATMAKGYGAYPSRKWLHRAYGSSHLCCPEQRWQVKHNIFLRVVGRIPLKPASPDTSWSHRTTSMSTAPVSPRHWSAVWWPVCWRPIQHLHPRWRTKF